MRPGYLQYSTVLYSYCRTRGFLPYEQVRHPLWILYGNMVDFSFIVSLYVSDLFNVTISTVPYPLMRRPLVSAPPISMRAGPSPDVPQLLPPGVKGRVRYLCVCMWPRMTKYSNSTSSPVSELITCRKFQESLECRFLDLSIRRIGIWTSVSGIVTERVSAAALSAMRMRMERLCRTRSPISPQA